MTVRLHSAAAACANTNNTVGFQTVIVAGLDVSSFGLNNVPFDIEALLIGIDTGSNAAGKARISRGFKRIAGAVSALAPAELLAAGANGALLGEAGVIAALASLSFVGNVINLNATGIVGLNMTWTGYLWINSGEF